MKKAYPDLMVSRMEESKGKRASEQLSKRKRENKYKSIKV
jgi:hypothetical protein